MINTSKAYEDYVVFVYSKALRGRSKAEYLRQVRKLGRRHPERSLKQISERMVFDHLIYLREKEKLRPSTLKQAVVALRMFYRDYLQRDCKLWQQFEIRRDRPLPVVLTRDEVHQLLTAVRENRFKAVLALIYHCGLPVGEAVRLRPKDIDSKREMLFCNSLLSHIQRSHPNAARHCAKPSSKPPHESYSNNEDVLQPPDHAEQNPLCANLPNNNQLWLACRACHPTPFSHCPSLRALFSAASASDYRDA